MSNLMLSARESHKEISINCPYCRFTSKISVSYLEDAIKDKLEIVCCVCEHPFKIVVMPLDTLRRPTQRAADVATVIENNSVVRSSPRRSRKPFGGRSHNKGVSMNKYVKGKYYWLDHEKTILSQCVRIDENEVAYFQIIGLSVLYTEKDFEIAIKTTVK